MDPEERLQLIAALAQDRAWDAVVMIGRALLDAYYPATVFVSGVDPGSAYIVALRKALDQVDEIESARGRGS